MGSRIGFTYALGVGGQGRIGRTRVTYSRVLLLADCVRGLVFSYLEGIKSGGVRRSVTRVSTRADLWVQRSLVGVDGLPVFFRGCLGMWLQSLGCVLFCCAF